MDLITFLFLSATMVTGGSRGRVNPTMARIRSVNGTCPPAVKDCYYTKMAHILVSVHSVFFEPHA